MSKIGKKPIKIEEKVTVEIDGRQVKIKGPKGELSYTLPPEVSVKIEDGWLIVSRRDDSIPAMALHGTWRAHLQNAVTGVTAGFKRELELVGLGYRAEVKGQELVLLVGFSHPVSLSIPEGLTVSVEKNKISVAGINKEKVGLFAAKTRHVRPPEPYKGTGIKYSDEVVRRKAGKSAKAVGPAAT